MPMIISSRQKEIILWFTGVGITVGSFLGLDFAFEREARPRMPASLEKQILLKELTGLDHHHGKAGGSLRLEIRAPGKRSLDASSGSTIALEAEVEALANLEGLRYNWRLPEGVTAEGGDLEGEIGSLAEGAKTTLQITLVSQTLENRQVHLHVYRMVNGETMGNVAQYNTVLQEKIDEDIQRKAEILSKKSTEAEENGAESLKLIQ